MEDILNQSVPCRLSFQDNNLLLEDFTKEDVKAAIGQIHPLKAPGKDGLPGLFYHNHWEAVGDEVITTCLAVLNNNEDCKCINDTLLCLIPKVKDPIRENLSAEGRALGLVRNKVWDKLQGWKMGLFSQAGRKVLIKSIIQAIQVYVMSCFRLSKGIIHEIQTLITRFWWGSTEAKHQIHWGDWEKLCKDKWTGGMGVKDLEDFNQALLAKQAWKLVTNPNSLFAQVMKALYFPSSELFEARKGTGCSNVWQGILWGRELLLKGTRWRVPPNSLVETLINEAGDWKLDALEEKMNKDDIPLILGIQTMRDCGEDELIWNPTIDGEYTVASCYRMKQSEKEGAETSNKSITKGWWIVALAFKFNSKNKELYMESLS
uniref:Reverse transcriptase n=1 Tax=Cannabis sativa TaxID=3483 RepID=A0A803Q7L1_CANSA